MIRNLFTDDLDIGLCPGVNILATIKVPRSDDSGFFYHHLVEVADLDTGLVEDGYDGYYEYRDSLPSHMKQESGQLIHTYLGINVD